MLGHVFWLVICIWDKKLNPVNRIAKGIFFNVAMGYAKAT